MSNPAPDPAPWLFELAGGAVVEMNTCPLPAITEFSKTMLRLHPYWLKGWPLVAGGFLDQPARYVALMETIDAQRELNAKRDEERRRRMAGA